MVVLNNAYKAMAYTIPNDFKDYCLDELRANGYLSYETIHSIHEETVVNTSFDPYHREIVSSREHHYNIARLVKYKGSVVARITLHRDTDEPSQYLTDLSAVFTHYVEKRLLSGQESDFRYTSAFDTLVTDLIDQRLTSPVELSQRLKQFGNVTLSKYYQPLILIFERPRESIPWNFIVTQLGLILPDCPITIYQNDIILLMRKDHHYSKVTLDESRLMTLLENYNGYAGIGNYSKFLTSLRSLYIQTKAAIQYGIAFRKSKQTRIFRYEEYSMYHMVALCADAFQRLYQNSDLIYLCHPGIIALERFDKKYDNNLKDVLYHYLMNDRNSAQTAKELFIHRNTMLYKINKIEEIIGQSLDDPLLRERLLFSFRILEYAEKMMHKDLLVLNYDKKL